MNPAYNPSASSLFDRGCRRSESELPPYLVAIQSSSQVMFPMTQELNNGTVAFLCAIAAEMYSRTDGTS